MTSFSPNSINKQFQEIQQLIKQPIQKQLQQDQQYRESPIKQIRSQTISQPNYHGPLRVNELGLISKPYMNIRNPKSFFTTQQEYLRNVKIADQPDKLIPQTNTPINQRKEEILRLAMEGQSIVESKKKEEPFVDLSQKSPEAAKQNQYSIQKLLNNQMNLETRNSITASKVPRQPQVQFNVDQSQDKRTKLVTTSSLLLSAADLQFQSQKQITQPQAVQSDNSSFLIKQLQQLIKTQQVQIVDLQIQLQNQQFDATPLKELELLRENQQLKLEIQQATQQSQQNAQRIHAELQFIQTSQKSLSDGSRQEIVHRSENEKSLLDQVAALNAEKFNWERAAEQSELRSIIINENLAAVQSKLSSVESEFWQYRAEAELKIAYLEDENAVLRKLGNE